jgi:hypothetical protein
MQCIWFAESECAGAVYLLYGRQREWVRGAECFDETAAVFNYGVAGVVGCEAKVEVCGAVVCVTVDRRGTTLPGAETVNQPGKAKPFGDLERFNGGGHCNCLSGHFSDVGFGTQRPSILRREFA